MTLNDNLKKQHCKSCNNEFYSTLKKSFCSMCRSSPEKILNFIKLKRAFKIQIGSLIYKVNYNFNVNTLNFQKESSIYGYVSGGYLKVGELIVADTAQQIAEILPIKRAGSLLRTHSKVTDTVSFLDIICQFQRMSRTTKT